MTARQSYHLTFARFSPSLSVKSFTASEAANTAYRVEITATSTDSSLPLSSYLNQRAAFEIRPQEAVLGGRIVRSRRRFFSRFGRPSGETMAGHCDFMRETVGLQG